MAELPQKPVSAARILRPSAFWYQIAPVLLAALVVYSWIELVPESAARLGRELHHGVFFLLLFSCVAVAALRFRGHRLPMWSFALVAGILLLQLWWLWH